jgi:hypothetical protein
MANACGVMLLVFYVGLNSHAKRKNIKKIKPSNGVSINNEENKATFLGSD